MVIKVTENTRKLIISKLNQKLESLRKGGHDRCNTTQFCHRSFAPNDTSRGEKQLLSSEFVCLLECVFSPHLQVN